MESYKWAFEWHVYIWLCPILKGKVKVTHILTIINMLVIRIGSCPVTIACARPMTWVNVGPYGFNGSIVAGGQPSVTVLMRSAVLAAWPRFIDKFLARNITRTCGHRNFSTSKFLVNRLLHHWTFLHWNILMSWTSYHRRFRSPSFFFTGTFRPFNFHVIETY